MPLIMKYNLTMKRPLPVSGRFRHCYSIEVVTTPAANVPFLGEVSVTAAAHAAARLTRAAYETQGYALHVLSYELARDAALDRGLTLCDPDETFLDSNLGSAIVEMLDGICRDWTFNI